MNNNIIDILQSVKAEKRKNEALQYLLLNGFQVATEGLKQRDS